MPQWNVRVNDGVASLLTVRSAPWQSLTVWLAEPVVPVVLVVKVAVLLCVVQVPAGSVNVFEYLNSVGLESVWVTVPSGPPRLSVTLTLPSTMVVGLPNAPTAEPDAQPSGVEPPVLAHDPVRGLVTRSA